MFNVIKSLFYNYKENYCDNSVDIYTELLKLLEYHCIDMLLADKLSLPSYRDIYSNKINKKNIVYGNNENYINAIKEINEAFNNSSISYVLLKGCALVIRYYQKTYHRSYNDIDFLISVKDIDKVEKILNEIRYIQGGVVDGLIVKAHRKDIIFQRINTHEIYHMVKFNE